MDQPPLLPKLSHKSPQDAQVLKQLFQFSYQKWFQNTMIRSEVDARQSLGPGLAAGLITSRDYDQLSTRLGSLRKWYYFQWHNIGPAFLLSPILLLSYAQTPPRRYIVPPLLFLLSVQTTSSLFRVVPAIDLFGVWDKLENPAGVLEAIRNLQPSTNGGIMHGRVPSEFAPDVVGDSSEPGGPPVPSPTETPTSLSEPESASHTVTRWEELRAASKNGGHSSSWDEIRQKHERSRVSEAVKEGNTTF
ncbi:hypothetical protein D9757_002843 [Collybiopsis confluens]|uniref:Uncharacterized protein n=1 Tax=Collybiopsis confluens TaxID=2823264 RepID=A0A8H5HV78_9AGAR|nr:hypothetical protein D9757_002843 [Collybiopsis confluens]